MFLLPRSLEVYKTGGDWGRSGIWTSKLAQAPSMCTRKHLQFHLPHRISWFPSRGKVQDPLNAEIGFYSPSPTTYPQKDGLTGKICNQDITWETECILYPVTKWAEMRFWHKYDKGPRNHSEPPTGATRTNASCIVTKLPLLNLSPFPPLHKYKSITNTLCANSNHRPLYECPYIQDQVSGLRTLRELKCKPHTLSEASFKPAREQWVAKKIAPHMDTHREVADPAKIWSPTAS